MAPTRPWVCSRAVGDVLEVAAGTGANLEYYDADATLTLTDWSVGMLEQARAKAARLGRAVEFRQADAMALPFDDASFDTVVATFSMCGVPQVSGALDEAVRVLRPGGRLLLVDHVISTALPVRLLQRALESVTKHKGEYWTRRPLEDLRGVEVVESQRSHFGVLERVHAEKPS